MAKPRVTINGFGRIGRLSLRANVEQDSLDIVAINDPGDIEQLAHLFKHDSVYGTFEGEIETSDNKIIVNGKEIQFISERDPSKLPWNKLDVDIVLECTGVFRERKEAAQHLDAGAKRVLISAPGKNVDITCCYGVNENKININEHFVVSNASCTTGGLAPVTKVIDDNFKIVHGLMTTIHSYTSTQNLIDSTHRKDWRRARAAAINLIPTGTGAAKAIGEVLPHLQGKLDGMAIRVPTPTVSLVDMTFEVEKATDAEEVNKVFAKAAKDELKGVLDISYEPLVSTDYRGNPHSSVVDAELTTVIGDGTMIKIMAWYDNEWGYSYRLIDMAARLGELLKSD